MPRYAPLPRIELDPRSEAELVAASARRVYEASSSTLNDFSSGSPIMALLEGQAFAQAEFLQFANEFPESVLVEWIGPFLGAQRRTGSGALVDVKFVIAPSDNPFIIRTGYQLSTDANLTFGESKKFVTIEDLVIPKGSVEGTVRCISIEMGAENNVAPRTIVKTITSLAGVKSVINLEPAKGGEDPELLSEVKERFFSLIRRRNPVSSEDWVDWFSDALGPGTSVLTLPRHSEEGVYLYEDSYISTNPSVSFHVLNPDGTPITAAQKKALETLMKWSLPLEFQGYIYSMQVDDVDVVLDLEYDPNKAYAQDIYRMTQTVRNTTFALMTPNAVFPVEYDPTPNDIEGALTSSFPATLGVSNRFTDPDVKGLSAYYTPQKLGLNTFVGLTPKDFVTGTRCKEGDLIFESSPYGDLFYEVLFDFEPVNNDRTYYTNTDKLDLTLIRSLTPGEYLKGEVISIGDNGDLYVILSSFYYNERKTIRQMIDERIISDMKEYTPFTDTIDVTGPNGLYDPDIVEYVQGDTGTVTHVPAVPVSLPINRRPGYPIYVAKQNFFVEPAVSTIGDAQENGAVTTDPVTVKLLVNETEYEKDTYVKTPDPSEVLTEEVSADSCYLSLTEGGKEIFFLVLKDFSLVVAENETYTNAVDRLIADGVLEVVDTIPFINCSGFPSFTSKPFRYQTRFGMGEYVRYRERGGFDSKLLEECYRSSEECDSLSVPCKRLFEQQLPLPRYFMATKDFTPYTDDINQMLEDDVMLEVERDLFMSTYFLVLPTLTPAYSASITTGLIANSSIATQNDLQIGETVEVVSDEALDRGLWSWNGGSWVEMSSAKPKARDMFRFAPGDVATFRQGSELRSYVAQKHVTPILMPDVYVTAGVFLRDKALSASIQWEDPTYRMEDIVLNTINGSQSFYRIIKPTTPMEETQVWNDQLVDTTPRIMELERTALKIVDYANCDKDILPRLSNGAGSIKLGVLQLNLTSKSASRVTDKYVWEATQYSSETPIPSCTPTLAYDRKPVDYGTGTLAL